jgi:hypothetical protein
MINFLIKMHEYIAIYSFLILTILSYIKKNYNAMGINFSLVLLYIFLFLKIGE